MPRWQLSLLRRNVRHLLFDFDDAVFLRDSYSPRGLHHPGRLARFAAMVRACDAVIAGKLRVEDMANLGSGVITVNGGTLQYSGSGATTGSWDSVS